MSNVLGFATARRTSRGNLLAGWLADGEIRCYTEPRPTDPDTALTTQTLLVTFEVPDPAGTVTNGILTGAAIAQAMVAATGTPAFARLVDSSGVVIGDADVGLTGSGAFVQLDNLNLVEGGYVSVTAFGITER